jgi:hypothetical protein
MALYNAEIILKDNPSKFNRELTEFIKRNLSKIINKGRIRFSYTIVGQNQLAELRKKGIKGLPAMVINGNPIVGVPNIKEILRKRVQTSKKPAKQKTNEEMMNEYFQNAINDTSKDDDDENPQNIDYSRRLQQAQEERAASFSSAHEGKNERPPSASRNVELDMGYQQNYDRSDTTVRPNRRPDNVEDAGDPIKTLARMQANGEGQQEDALLAKMFENMGTDF